MNEYSLSNEICETIVDGILQGYKNYLAERARKKKEMNVSGAYAWTKGNHIDDQISKISQDKGIKFSVKKAGHAWEYLQFTLNENDEQFMLIVKNIQTVEDKFDGKSKDNYMARLAKINNPILKNRTQDYTERPVQIRLELNYPELHTLNEEKVLTVNTDYSRFYIVTYEIDEDSKMIKSIQLTLPNSQTMNLEFVQDLTDFIKTSLIEITTEEVAPILGEKATENSAFSGDKDSFGYAVPNQEEKTKTS